MSLKSVFGSDQGVSPDKFPRPPNVREILEDIETSSADDPIIIFASALRKKGSGFETEEGEHLNKEESSIADWLDGSLAGAVVRDAKAIPQSTPKSPVSPVTKEITSRSSDDSSDFYDKFKQISTTSSKSEDLISKVESRLKELESECGLILTDFELSNKLT